MKVTDPDGTTWRVSRRWVPWRRRLKGALSNAPDFPALGEDPISLVIGTVLLIIAIPFLVLALIGGLELLLLLLVYPFALVARVLLSRHWHVEVRRGFRFVHEVDGGTWQESGAKIRELADQLERGALPEASSRR